MVIFNENPRFVIENIIGLTEEKTERLDKIKNILVNGLSRRFLNILGERLKRLQYEFLYKDSKFTRVYKSGKHNISRYPILHMEIKFVLDTSLIHGKRIFIITCEVVYLEDDKIKREVVSLHGLKDFGTVDKPNIVMWYIPNCSNCFNFNTLLWQPDVDMVNKMPRYRLRYF